MNPTLEELEKYQLIHEVDSDERLLWLGAPNMKYAFFLVSPATLLFSLILIAYWNVKFGLVYSSSDQNARAAIAFGCLFAFTFIFDLIVILSLKPFFYLITDKNLCILVKDGWYVNLLYYTRKARSGVLRYSLVYIGDFAVRKSFINDDVGNIYFDDSISSDGIIDQQNKTDKDIKFRLKRFPIQISTRVGYAHIFYCVNDVSEVCELLREAIQKARRRE